MPIPQGLIQRLMQYAGKNKDIVENVGKGSALSAGFGLLTGGPKEALAYGAFDFLTAYPATLLARKAGEKITKPIMGIPVNTLRGGLETTANFGASVSPFVINTITSKASYPEVTPTNMSQQQQLMQEMQQRAEINNMQVPQAVSPGTQFQMQGLEHTFLRNYTKPQSYMSEMMPEYDQYLSQLRSPLG